MTRRAEVADRPQAGWRHARGVVARDRLHGGSPAGPKPAACPLLHHKIEGASSFLLAP